MTLEQANDSALAAAEAGDLEELGLALRARAQALADLNNTPASTQLATRMAEALAAGESISRVLAALKRRVGCERARLARFESGLTAGLGFSRKARISYRA
jgi:hypothetical protein